MNIDKYRLHNIKFNANEWEFIHSLVLLRYSSKIRMLEVGEGNVSLLFGIITELDSLLYSLLSVDCRNKFVEGQREFYNKKIIFSTIFNRGCKFVEHFQEDALSDIVFSYAKKHFLNNPINFLMIEYMNNDLYMNSIFSKFSVFFDKNIDIYYHNYSKNEESEKYFSQLSRGHKSALFIENLGIGIIKDFSV